MALSEFDKTHIYEILSDIRYDWFTAKLLRLIAIADISNLEKLYKVYPEEVDAINVYRHGCSFYGEFNMHKKED